MPAEWAGQLGVATPLLQMPSTFKDKKDKGELERKRRRRLCTRLRKHTSDGYLLRFSRLDLIAVVCAVNTSRGVCYRPVGEEVNATDRAYCAERLSFQWIKERW